MTKTRKKVNNNICIECGWRKTHGTGNKCQRCKNVKPTRVVSD